MAPSNDPPKGDSQTGQVCTKVQKSARGCANIGLEDQTRRLHVLQRRCISKWYYCGPSCDSNGGDNYGTKAEATAVQPGGLTLKESGQRLTGRGLESNVYVVRKERPGNMR
jgi:hypothetical protein